MRTAISKLKPYLRWLIFGGTLFFVLKAVKDNWQELVAVRFESRDWLILLLSLFVTILAHIWSGWVWTWILQTFQQPMGQLNALQVYLKTNIAKYLPGNVWHFYGRIQAVSQAGGSLGVASLTVLLEPLLMAAAALLIALLSGALGLIQTASNVTTLGLQISGLLVVLLGIHPRILNPVILLLNGWKTKEKTLEGDSLKHYPFLPLMGEIGFLILRGIGFLLTLWAVMAINWQQIPQLLSAFSFAWLLGLIVPGAPGGLGVFEATIITLLGKQLSAVIIVGVALFRLVSILAESIAAFAAWLSEFQFNQ